MSAQRLRVILTATVCAYCAALVTLPPTALAAGSPGWSIHSVAQPTNFDATDSKNQKQSVTVSASGGSYELEVEIDRHSEFTQPIMWDETAEGLQQKLESLAIVGPGNVEVAGGPGGSQPYTIEYSGALSGSFVHLEELNAAHNHLTGGKATVEHAGIELGESRDSYTLVATNAGSAASEGEITIEDKLPSGVVATEAEVREPRSGNSEECTLAPVKCPYDGGQVLPGGELVVTLHVAVVSPSVTGPLTNEATVSGGGAAGASVSEPNPVNVGPAAFGIEQVGFETVGPDGMPDTQAGDRPYGVTTTIDLNTVIDHGLSAGREPLRLPRKSRTQWSNYRWDLSVTRSRRNAARRWICRLYTAMTSTPPVHGGALLGRSKWHVKAPARTTSPFTTWRPSTDIRPSSASTPVSASRSSCTRASCRLRKATACELRFRAPCVDSWKGPL